MKRIVAALRLSLSALGSLLLCLLVWLLRSTWRMRVIGSCPGAGRNLFVYWHGDQLVLSKVRLKQRLTVLVSRSRDGQWASRVASLLGYEVLRGSTSAGAVAGAVGIVRRLLSGRPVGLAVDGPRGPRHRVGDSPRRLARRGRAALVPVAASASRGLHLGTWDRFLVPAPFATVYIVFGDPVEANGVVQQGLDRVTERACALAGEVA